MTTIGTRYGQRTVIGEAPRDGRNSRRLFVRCDCGNDGVALLSDLERGEADSCVPCGRAKMGIRKRPTINVKLRLVRTEDTRGLPAMPRNRSECRGAERPCPHMSCAHHLALDVTHRGSVVVEPDPDLAAMPDTCALDVADRGPHGLVEIGARMGLTRERVRQISEAAERKLAANPEAAQVWRDWLEWRAGLPHPDAMDETAEHGDLQDVKEALDRFIARRAQEAAE
jgi:hypothetical protein